jgi:hypothetical protein
MVIRLSRETFAASLWSNYKKGLSLTLPRVQYPRSFVTITVLGCVLSLAPAFAQKSEPSATSHPASSGSNASAPILPQEFGGWQMQGSPRTNSDPASADAANSAILKEYGFTDFASSTYTRDDGRTLKIRAARFADASGAFGAYTFYLQPEMKPERVGDQAASLISNGGQRVLFYRGHVLVDAIFSQQSAMSAAQLRELAGELPRPAANAGNLPSFIAFLPHQDYIPNTQKYAMGPLALNLLSPPVSPDVVDFGASSEVTLANYDTPSGEATLMLISYPTPQLAADHLHRIEAEHHEAQSQPGVSVVECAGTFCSKRTGPILAIATGAASASDAKSLLGQVNWEASVTWNTPAESAQVHDLTMLILNIVVLCAILAGLAIVAGVAFGGIRILMKRMYPDKVFDRPEQMEFISLRLTETIVEVPPESDPESGRQAS